MMPGELSLAHHGVLFLDQLTEFNPILLENLRQPLEQGVLEMARAGTEVTFPARIQLVAALNPCACSEGDTKACRCSPQARSRYRRRLSIPLLERFDLRVELERPASNQQEGDGRSEPTHEVAARVVTARHRARARGVNANVELTADRLYDATPLDTDATRLTNHALSESRLTGRGLDSVRRVALTIADLAGDQPPLGGEHIGNALALHSDLCHVVGRTA